MVRGLDLYQRRKILLALVETFGGSLTPVDCHKLMFLLCQRTKKNHYDFFPYKFGACSFVLHQDKLRLTDLGYLDATENFRVTESQRFFTQVEANIQNELRSLANDIGSLRGRELLKKVYLEYPYYASKSLIAQDLLDANEYRTVEQSRNGKNSPNLFTIGYEGITIDSYLSKLIDNDILVLVDVRKNPISKKYGFSKSQLKRYVENIDIAYVHLPELGIPSELRQNLDSEQAYLALFKQYDNDILPRQNEVLAKLKSLIYEKKRVALTCFEASYCFCHRSRVTQYFQNDPSFEIPVQHL
jgi:uncharacterized protein (DUF488 family)